MPTAYSAALNHQKVWNDGSGIVRSDVYAIGNLHYEFLNDTRSMSRAPASPMQSTGFGGTGGFRIVW
ncbi:hypothetical protein [Bradyrhizobium sp. USDA 10063]